MPKLDWIIEIIANGVACAKCGRVEDTFPEYIFEDCPVRLDSFQETGREVLRVIIPDSQNRFPEDPNCDYPYSFQLVPTNTLAQGEGGIC